MSAPDPLSVLLVPGRLATGPTDFSTAFPHGGTQLGLVQDVRWRRELVQVPIKSEEFGTTVDYLYAGEAWFLAATLRGADDDALAALFENVAAGGTSPHQLITHDPDAGNRAGILGSVTSAVAIVFTPDDQLRHPAIYFPNAVPMLEESVEASLDIDDEHLIPIVFAALPHDSKPAAYFGRLEDFTV